MSCISVRSGCYSLSLLDPKQCWFKSTGNSSLTPHAQTPSGTSLPSQTLVSSRPCKRAIATAAFKQQIKSHGPRGSPNLSSHSFFHLQVNTERTNLSCFTARHPLDTEICADRAQISKARPGVKRSTRAGARRTGNSGVVEPSESTRSPDTKPSRLVPAAPLHAPKPYNHVEKQKGLQVANLGAPMIHSLQETRPHAETVKRPASALQELPKSSVNSSKAHATTNKPGPAFEASKPSEASKSSETSRSSGSLLGAVALITGTSVGAGILALPGISAPAGFVPATSIMLGCWVFLVGEALLLAEVNVELLKRVAGDKNRASDVLSLRTMAQKTLGPVGGAAATLAYVFLTYILLTAYVAKSADVLSLLSGLPTEWAGIAFVGCFGAALLVGGNVFTDYVNQAATGVMLALFLILVGGGSVLADWSVLEQADWRAAPAAVPIIFLSLVYHDLTPVLCSYLDGDIVRIRQAIVGGSLVPLLMFVACNAVALAVSPITGGGDPLNIIVRLGGPGPAALIEAFSLLAISTSLIGTILGATEFALEQLGGLQFAVKRPPQSEGARHAGLTAPVNNRGAITGLGAGLNAGLGLTKPDSRGLGTEVRAFVEGEGDRLQKRVEAEVLQWDSRFEPGASNGQNARSSEVYGVDSSGSGEGFHTSSSILDSSTLGVSPPGVNTHSQSSAQSQSLFQGNGINSRSRYENPGGFGILDSGRSGGTRSVGESLDSLKGVERSTEGPETGGVNWALRTGAFGLVLVPPVAVASQYPDAFFQASNIAGAYGMTTLYGLFPVAMAWSMRSSVKSRADAPNDARDYVQLVPGGRFTLVSMGLIAAAIMAGQAVLDGKLATGAISDALTDLGPALGVAQAAAALVGAAVSDAFGHVQSWAGGADALDTVRHSFGQSIAALYGEVLRLVDGLDLDGSVPAGLDPARVSVEGLTISFEQTRGLTDGV